MMFCLTSYLGTLTLLSVLYYAFTVVGEVSDNILPAFPGQVESRNLGGRCVVGLSIMC